VFRIIETTRYAERNRLCFTLSIFVGLRVGEIAKLTVGDVATQTGDVRREIKLGAHQTKGSKGRTVILSERVRKEIGSFLKNQTKRDHGAPLIASQRDNRPFTNVTLSMLFKEIYDRRDQNVVTFGKTDVCNTPQRKRGWHADHPTINGSSPHWNDGAIL
jgi:integrase